VAGVGKEDEPAVRESLVEGDGVLGGHLSLSPLRTSTGWRMLARSAGFISPQRWMALSWARNEREGDDPMLGGDAVRDPGIPVVQDRPGG
jgi:hypothetical protein